MKNCWKNRYIVLGLSLILALLVFFLITPIVLTEVTILILLVIGAVSLISLLIANVMVEKSKDMKEAYCCCGSLATIGSGGIVLASILSLLTIGTGLVFSIAVAAIIFFFGLLIGGIWCFLKAYNHCDACDCNCNRISRYDKNTDTWK